MQEIADKTKSHNLRTDQGLRTEEMTAVLHTTPSAPGQALHSNKQIEQDHEHPDLNHRGRQNHLPDPTAAPGQPIEAEPLAMTQLIQTDQQGAMHLQKVTHHR